ncbi:signal transducer and activator of transcription 2 [Aythya fuligula]|uniref:Signal transducer and activator of transcription n=1 Tax=Aythya fuligula TaxID=219594 RepID=A0A6J3EBV5_AYTFU|nr:signal transducer and activator of transcription 2 [Aythya fuligula]
MAQWQEVQNLANTHLEQVHQLYAAAALPMAVRQCLAAWIEDQDWQQATEPLSSHARMLFHSLLALLDERLGSLGLGDEDFMLKHNLRKARRDLQAAFEECPESFANLVANLLQEERRILRLGQASGQGEAAPAPSTPLKSDREQEIQRRLAEFHTALQEFERVFRHLEDLQDAFDFCYKVHYLPGQDQTNEAEYKRQVQSLQAKLLNLDRQRREVVAQMQQLLGRSETLRDFLQQELKAWQERQQRSCLGAPVDTRLQQLEGWFTGLGEGLFQLLQLLRALGELQKKVTYERDPLQAETPLLETRLREQLTCLLQSAFVVEQQPSMPNTPKRPLVLRTASKFCTRARLLVRLHDRNHRMEATIHIDRDPPKTRGFRKFNILTSSSKTLLAGENSREGLICDFQYLTLKEQKISGSGKGNKGCNEGPLAVTEELHRITFTLAYAYCGLEMQLETSTLPFVIISNSNNQLSSAWASILWFNMLSPNPKDQQFFATPPPAPWPLLAEVLSWQFESVAERGLSREHLQMLAEKLLGSKPSPESVLTWSKFSKDGAAGFSFWAWLDGILGLLQEHLKKLWKDGLILGFVSRKQEKKLLKGKRTGTFLIRFSESVLGGVTFTWVEHPESGRPAFRAVVPYTSVELASLALPDIIRDYQLLAEENIPENPLLFLYPDTPRDKAFGPHYSQRQEGSLTEKKEYLKQRLIRVSSRQANEAWQTEEELVVATENLETLQLQPSRPGFVQPTSPGTVPVVAGSPGVQQPLGPGTLQPVSPGVPQVVAASPGTQHPRGPGTLQPGAWAPEAPPQVGPGGLEMLQAGTGVQEPQLVLQLIPKGQGTVQMGAGSLGTLQVLPGGTGMLQQGGAGDQRMQQVAAGAVEPQMLLQLIPEGQGMLQVGAGNLGTLQVVPGVLGTLQSAPGATGVLQQVGAGDQGLPQPGPGAAEPLPVADDQGLLPAGLEDLGPVLQGPGMQELLQCLEQDLDPGTGTLETLEAVELMPNMDSGLGQMDARLGGNAALLDPSDPFLPQPEDTALPAASSLFAVDTDFPPLHIDASDFQ